MYCIIHQNPPFADGLLLNQTDSGVYEGAQTALTQNAYIESFNGRFRDECLNQHWFTSIGEAREIIEDWRVDYNTERPHSSLKYQTPEEFAAARPFQKSNGRRRLSYLKATRPRPLLTQPNDGTQMESKLDLRVALKKGAGHALGGRPPAVAYWLRKDETKHDQ